MPTMQLETGMMTIAVSTGTETTQKLCGNLRDLQKLLCVSTSNVKCLGKPGFSMDLIDFSSPE
jgi:hypothetical protein